MGNPDRPQKTMFLITAYFDEATTHKLQDLIDEVSAVTGNYFMQENHIPPHLTLCQLQTRSGGEILAEALNNAFPEISDSVPVSFLSFEDGIPKNVYTKAGKTAEIEAIIAKINKGLSSVPDIKISPFYQPQNIYPHVTLGKRLSQEQQKKLMEIFQKQFRPFSGTITEIGLSCGKPPVDLWRISLR